MVELGGPVKVIEAVPPEHTELGPEIVGETTLMVSVQRLGAITVVDVHPFKTTLVMFNVVVVVIGLDEKLTFNCPVGDKTPDWETPFTV